MKTILVTGGAGYIGTHTCVELLNENYEVIVVDNLSNSSEVALKRVEDLTGKKIKFYQADLLDYESLKTIFKENHIESVIHFAGLKAVGESNVIPLNYYHNNITSTLHLVQLMKEYKVLNLVFSSSATVYGNPATLPIKENFPVSATNPYGNTKLFIEQILTDFQNSDHSFNIALLRYFNPAGAHKSGRIGEDPNDIPNNLMPYISQVAVGKLEELSVYGNDYNTKDGTGVRDYIHVVDLAKGHIAAIKKLESTPGLVKYNLGTGKGYSVLEMIQAFEKMSGRKIQYKITGRRPGDIAACYADPTLAKKEIGWEAEYGIEDMVIDTWKWQKNNPDGYK